MNLVAGGGQVLVFASHLLAASFPPLVVMKKPFYFTIRRYPAGLVLYWKPMRGGVCHWDGAVIVNRQEWIGYSRWKRIPWTKWLGKRFDP